MPSRSEAQRRLFAIAEHNPSILYKRNKSLANLPKKTLHEFASSVDSSFYGHLHPNKIEKVNLHSTGGL